MSMEHTTFTIGLLLTFKVSKAEHNLNVLVIMCTYTVIQVILGCTHNMCIEQPSPSIGSLLSQLHWQEYSLSLVATKREQT